MKGLFAKFSTAFNIRVPFASRCSTAIAQEAGSSEKGEQLSGNNPSNSTQTIEELLLQTLGEELGVQLNSFSDKIVRQLRRLSVLSEEQSRQGTTVVQMLGALTQLLQQVISESSKTPDGLMVDCAGTVKSGEDIASSLKINLKREINPVDTNRFVPPLRITQGLSFVDKLYKLAPLLSDGEIHQRSKVAPELLWSCIREIEEAFAITPVAQIGVQYDSIAADIAGVVCAEGRTGDVHEVLRQGYFVGESRVILRKALVTVIKSSANSE